MKYWYKTFKLSLFKTTYALILNKSWDRLSITLNWAARVPAPYTSKSLTEVIKKVVRNTKLRYWIAKKLPADYAIFMCPYHQFPEKPIDPKVSTLLCYKGVNEIPNPFAKKTKPMDKEYCIHCNCLVIKGSKVLNTSRPLKYIWLTFRKKIWK